VILLWVYLDLYGLTRTYTDLDGLGFFGGERPRFLKEARLILNVLNVAY